MRVRTYFLLFVLLIAVNFIAVRWHFGLPDGAVPFLYAALWGLTIVCFVRFYRRFVRPLRSIENGMLLLKEQDFSSRLSTVGQYEVDRIVEVFNRMMQQLKSERLRLREQNQFLDLLFRASPMGILQLDLEGRISSLNPAACRLLGVEEESSRGKPLSALGTELTDRLAALHQEETVTVRLSDAGICRCACLSFLDRGQRHAFYLVEPLTEEVMRAEKEAYEKVIRMIAHEVNNTVAGVNSTLETLDEALSEQPGTSDLREAVSVCTERSRAMSRFITRFAEVVKLPAPVLAPADLNEMVRTEERFLEAMCRPRHILLRMELAKEAVRVSLDAVLFRQVLVNIVKNAAESIDRDGTILIRTTVSPPSLEVADSGPGISPEDEARLFTPFFSTKPGGQGIGLMLVREVLMKHRCSFSLRTEAGGMTRFRICFR